MAKKKAPPNLKKIGEAQILSDDSFLAHHKETRDAGQQRIWTFYEDIKIHFINTDYQ